MRLVARDVDVLTHRNDWDGKTEVAIQSRGPAGDMQTEKAIQRYMDHLFGRKK